MRRSDRGSVTLWVLGLSMMLLLFGGLALDFWRGLAQQRQLFAVADAASVAGAAGIDEEVWRTTGEAVLDPERARSLALATIALQDAELTSIVITTDPDGSEVAVVVEGELRLGLLGVFIDDREPLTLRARATAVPRVRP